ncbi:MAG: WecB/TagA/CpsF family glycosyltransferase [Hyphomicrobiales bacterium]|nr:WecB/TagA/CpsF family glycosyltransferase [Hyphomicrobiales bacterium]
MAVYQSAARASESPKTMVDIDSWRINVPDQTFLIDRILSDLRMRQGGTVFTINLDHLSKLRDDVAFREAYGRARYVTADGMPVVALARIEGATIERVTGADLVEPLCRAAATARIPVYFFGATDAVLARAVERLRAVSPDLVVAGLEAPPMGFDPHGQAAADAARRIAASGAGICFVALGAPKQEFFADAASRAVDGVTWLGIGAALDFLAGHRVRAPRPLQVVGLEWLWRAAQEPRRLFPRYVASARWLIGYVLRNALGLDAAKRKSRAHD